MARGARAFAQVHGESLSIMVSSERAQESTFTVESFLTSDVRHETHLQGRDPSLAPLVERLRDGKASAYSLSRRPGAMPRGCGSCSPTTILRSRSSINPHRCCSVSRSSARRYARPLESWVSLAGSSLGRGDLRGSFRHPKKSSRRRRQRLIRAISSPA